MSKENPNQPGLKVQLKLLNRFVCFQLRQLMELKVIGKGGRDTLWRKEPYPGMVEMPIVPAKWETEAGGLLEPKSLGVV